MVSFIRKKNCDICPIFDQIIDCGGSNEYTQSIF